MVCNNKNTIKKKKNRNLNHNKQITKRVINKIGGLKSRGLLSQALGSAVKSEITNNTID